MTATRMTNKEAADKRRTAEVAALNRTLRRTLANIKAPPTLSVSQWADRYRRLSSENSAEAGPWKTSRTPYLRDIMDAFTDARVHDINVVASSQVGKTEVLLNMLGYAIDCDPGPTMYVLPTLDNAKDFSKRRISPMVRDCKRLRSKISDVRSRDSENTVLKKTYPGGMLTLTGSNSPASLASVPARYVFGDEIDRWAKSAGTEGDPGELLKQRTKTFYNAKRVKVSTPTIKGDSAIETAFYQGTQERWCHRCPECGEWHNIVFDNIKFTYDTEIHKGKKQYTITSVAWCCPSCGCLSDEATMRKQPARWIAERPEAIVNGCRSFWLNAFCSPWESWANICRAFLDAKDDPERLKVVFNTQLGELWEDRGDLADEDSLLARREDYGARPDGSTVELPEGVLALTCGVDTQDDRLEYEVLGHGHYGETFGIRFGRIMGDPNTDAPWLELDDVLDRVWRFANGRGLRIGWTCVDSGGHKTEAVYKQCLYRQSKRVFAIKGQGGESVPFTALPTKKQLVINGNMIGTAYLYIIGVDAGKAAIMSAVKVQEPGAKYCHWPRHEAAGYDANYFNGLLSEKLTRKREKGRDVWKWEKLPGHLRNEPLDCNNYARAAFRIWNPDLDAAERRLRGAAETATPAPAAKPVQRARKNNNFDAW